MNELQVVEKSGQRVLLTNQLADSYGTDTKTITRNFQRNSNRYIEGKHYFALTGDGLKMFKARNNMQKLKFASVLYLWTKEGALTHFSSLRSSGVIPSEIIDYFGIKDEIFVIASSKEIEFINLLETQLKILGVNKFDRQHSLKNKRVDLFLPELNVAIEYDELTHNQYSYKNEMGRQKMIENESGCFFIRVTEDKSHEENSAIVIKELIENGYLIFRKKGEWVNEPIENY